MRRRSIVGVAAATATLMASGAGTANADRFPPGTGEPAFNVGRGNNTAFVIHCGPVIDESLHGAFALNNGARGGGGNCVAPGP